MFETSETSSASTQKGELNGRMVEAKPSAALVDVTNPMASTEIKDHTVVIIASGNPPAGNLDQECDPRVSITASAVGCLFFSFFTGVMIYGGIITDRGDEVIYGFPAFFFGFAALVLLGFMISEIRKVRAESS